MFLSYDFFFEISDFRVLNSYLKNLMRSVGLKKNCIKALILQIFIQSGKFSLEPIFMYLCTSATKQLFAVWVIVKPGSAQMSMAVVATKSHIDVCGLDSNL